MQLIIAFMNEQNHLVAGMDTMTESNEDGSKCETVTDGQAEGNAETLNSNGDENAMDDIPEHLREFDVLDEVHGDSGSEADDRDEDGNVFLYSVIHLITNSVRLS